MEWINFESGTGQIVVGLVVLIIGWIGVSLFKLYKRWARSRQLKFKMHKAILECRTKTLQFKKCDDSDLTKHLHDVVLAYNPYSNWLTFDEDGWDQRVHSVAGQKYQALIAQTKYLSHKNATDGTPEGLRAYADEIVLKIDELSPHLWDPWGDP